MEGVMGGAKKAKDGRNFPKSDKGLIFPSLLCQLCVSSIFVFSRKPQILFGKTLIQEFGPEIKMHGIKKVLAVFRGGSVKTNGV
jgi:hypothetical protein